jgi:hypothetical protein
VSDPSSFSALVEVARKALPKDVGDQSAAA